MTPTIIDKIVDRALYRHLLSAFFAVCVCGPFLYWALDREPPWVRLSGTIEPAEAGGYFRVHWQTTPLKRACGGTLQIEIMSGRLIWPVLLRPVSEQLKIGQTEYTPEPWPVFSDIPPGEATYRVTSFWYCNWMQSFFDWPIVQVGPDIKFIVLKQER